MQAATASNPRRQKLRRVIYKSTALERTAPNLVAAASTERVSAAQSIQNANAAAENVRLAYKQHRDTELAIVEGQDDVSNAQKYERRLKMNRQSAAASRVRREAYTKALEAELVKMESEYKMTVVRLQAALERNRQLEKPQDPELVEANPGLEEEALECPTDRVVEIGDDELGIPKDDDVEEVAVKEEDPEVVRALAELEPSEIDEFFTQTTQPKLELLLSDPVFTDNNHVLNFPIADTLPDCFIHPPFDHELGGNELS